MHNSFKNLHELHLSPEKTIIHVWGWIKDIRKHSKMIFIVLYDYSGSIQIVIHKELLPKTLLDKVNNLTIEDVIAIKGTLQNKSPLTLVTQTSTNVYLKELIFNNLEFVNHANLKPFDPNSDLITSHEDTQLKYRYLALRNQKLQRNLRFRSNVIHAIRDFLIKRDFVEIETPILTKPTPEGARDFLVKADRIVPNSFYALPQSPQIYKQLLMVGGFKRYFQIARCFRDEDNRSDRQPEFTQLDIEISFTSRGEIKALVEDLLKHLFSTFCQTTLPDTFLQMSYQTALAEYQSDKPDLRSTLKTDFACCWVVDWPLFSFQNDHWQVMHHPFTAPQVDYVLNVKNKTKLESVLSTAYDIVINGIEIGGGSLRNHNIETQTAIFEILGLEKSTIDEMFGTLLNALQAGCPPHGGIAIGIDRLLQVMLNLNSIREVIAFPKNSQSFDLMLSCPYPVNQMKELVS